MGKQLLNDEKEYLCAECKAQVKEEDQVCPNCGADLKEKAKVEKISKKFSFKSKKVKYTAIILAILVLTIMLMPKPSVFIYWDDKMMVEGVTSKFKLTAFLFPRPDLGPNPTNEYGANNDTRWQLVMNLSPEFSDRIYLSPGTDIIWRSKPNHQFIDGEHITVDKNHCFVCQSFTRKCWNSIKYLVWKIKPWT